MRTSVAFALLLLAACGEPRHARHEWTTPAVRRSARPRLERPSIGGLFLGAPFLRESDRCGRFVVADRWSGTCAEPPQSVGYPVESVFLRRCEHSEVCQITVRVRVEGETQLQHALADVLEQWSTRYGTDYDLGHETDAECDAELRATRFACLLRGEGRFLQTWRIPSDRYSVPTGSRAQVSAFGAAGTQLAMIRLTLATPDGIRAASERDL